MVLNKAEMGIRCVCVCENFLTSLIGIMLGSFLVANSEPGVFNNLGDVVSLAHISVKHTPDEVDALFAHDEGDPQIAVHDLVDAVEGILLVDDGVEKDT